MNNTIKIPDFGRSSRSHSHDTYLSSDEILAMGCPYFNKPNHCACDGCNLWQACSEASNKLEYV